MCDTPAWGSLQRRKMGKDDAKKAAKLKRQEKAALKAGAVAKKDKVDEVDEVGEAIKDAANTLGNVLNIASSKASANADLAKARNSTGEIPRMHFEILLSLCVCVVRLQHGVRG